MGWGIPAPIFTTTLFLLPNGRLRCHLVSRALMPSAEHGTDGVLSVPWHILILANKATAAGHTGPMSSSHISASGLRNTNGPDAAVRDFGQARAEAQQ
jgi:hypothetical protein